MINKHTINTKISEDTDNNDTIVSSMPTKTNTYICIILTTLFVLYLLKLVWRIISISCITQYSQLMRLAFENNYCVKYKIK